MLHAAPIHSPSFHHSNNISGAEHTYLLGDKGNNTEKITEKKLRFLEKD
jgi:hypothetical protein